MILAKEGLVGAGEVVALGISCPRSTMLASAPTSSAILMSAMSGADLLLSMWMSDKRVAVSLLVTVLAMAVGVAEAGLLVGTFPTVSPFSLFFST